MPQVYSSKDAGLPAFHVSSSSANSLLRFNNYKLIFKACLVTGYGARAAAGWTLIDEGDQYLVLRNAAGNYFSISSGYYITSTNLTYHGTFRVFLHATYTGMGANGVPIGQGVVSGTSGASTLPIFFGSDLFYWSVNARWMLMADDRTFIFSMLSYTSTASSITGASIDTQNANGTLYVGDDLGGNHIAVGGYLSTTPTAQPNIYFDRLAITTLKNPKTGLLVDTSPIVAFCEAALGMVGPNATQTTASGLSVLTTNSIVSLAQLEMGLVRWTADGDAQPGLRGIRRETLMARNYANLTRRMLEGDLTDSDYNVGTILDFLPLDDGYCYLPLMAHVGSRCALIITDNPAYW